MKTFSSLQDLGKQSLQIFAGTRRDKRARGEVIRHKVRTIPSPVLQCPSCWFLFPLTGREGKHSKTVSPVVLSLSRKSHVYLCEANY